MSVFIPGQYKCNLKGAAVYRRVGGIMRIKLKFNRTGGHGLGFCIKLGFKTWKEFCPKLFFRLSILNVLILLQLGLQF